MHVARILPVFSYKGSAPRFSSSCFIADSATLCGDITLGEECSVWFGAVLRAELAPVDVGNGSNVQDNCVIHTDLNFPSRIGNNVTLGHSALIHGATVGSNCLIGMRSTLLNGSKIGDNCMVAAGSLVTQNTEVPEGSLVMGSPAVVKRKLTAEEIRNLGINAKHYREFRAEYLKARLKV